MYNQSNGAALCVGYNFVSVFMCVESMLTYFYLKFRFELDSLLLIWENNTNGWFFCSYSLLLMLLPMLLVFPKFFYSMTVSCATRLNINYKLNTTVWYNISLILSIHSRHISLTVIVEKLCPKNYEYIYQTVNMCVLLLYMQSPRSSSFLLLITYCCSRFLFF